MSSSIKLAIECVVVLSIENKYDLDVQSADEIYIFLTCITLE